jgi:uncharacterized protein YlbG (UPF0298 family)
MIVVYCESRKREPKRFCIVYYESRKRELKIRLMNEGRCDERLKAKVEESTCVTYTGLHDDTEGIFSEK